MPGFAVESINDGKVNVFVGEEIPVEVFGQDTWEKMKNGYYLPWIVVREIKPVVAFAPMAASEGHTLPWQSGLDEFPCKKKPLRILE